MIPFFGRLSPNCVKHKERPVKVVQAIYSKPPDAVQEFAKAFRVRKEK
jgi:hypothetical protein